MVPCGLSLLIANGRRARADRLSQTVFVLEDETDISRLVQHHLEAAGFSARLFHTPTNLISDAERQPPALFLLDIMVPGGDGLDVCRRLRTNPALSTIPIIFLTARAGENDRVLGLELGADDYITKPFATRELVARVKAVLRRFERPTSPSIISFEEVIIDASAMQLNGARRADHHHGDRVPAARLSGAPSGPGFQPRPPAGRGLGRCALCHSPLG